MAARKDPYKNFNFRVEIAGLTIAGFKECTGLSSEVGCIEYREGGDLAVRKIPGLHKVGDITLKRGVTASAELQEWHQNIVNGVIDRRDGVITLLDDDMSPVVRWKFFNAFPRKWEGPEMNGTSNDVAIESLTVCCERIERET